jgi:type II secretory pathway pseudopilin PulG
MNKIPQKRSAHPSEEGYILVAVIFMMVILIISLSVAVPKVRESIQRDRDQETMERGKQYIRAIQLYYKKFKAYPPNIDALVKTNDIRFLRKKYIDPTTGKDEWKPILWGQNKTPMAMGFFGQPLAMATGGGIGPGGANTGPVVGSGAANASGNNIFAPPGSNSPGASTDNGQAGASGTGNSGQTGGSTAAGGTGTTDTGASGTTGTGTTGTGTSGTNGSAFGSSSNPTGTGQSFGGGGIIGFSPQSPKQSILVYKKKNHYNQWEFLYSPLMDQQQMGGGNTGIVGQPAGSTTIPIGGSSFSGQNSGGTNTGGTTPQTPPQQ